MKTLDEVIKAIEYCKNHNWCNECPYQPYQNEDICYEEDSLHYLKELRHILDNTVWIESSKEENGYWKLPTLPETGNDPLTWDDLKKMEGKPIWLEWLADDIWSDPNHREIGTWWVVGEVRKNDIIIAQYLDEAELCEDDLGVIWLAYSKEKNE